MSLRLSAPIHPPGGGMNSLETQTKYLLRLPRPRAATLLVLVADVKGDTAIIQTTNRRDVYRQTAAQLRP